MGERLRRPPGAPIGGTGGDRSVLQQVLELADDRVVPTTLRKRTLTELCHTLEDQVLQEDLAAVVIAGFQQARFWAVERERYARLCADPRRRSLVFAADPAPRTDGVTYVAVGDEHPLAREWFVLALTERFSAVLFGRELTVTDDAEERERAFLTAWSFDPSLVEDLLSLLASAAEDLAPAVGAALADAAHRHPPRRPTGGAMPRFGNAVFERLEAQGARWQQASADLQRANEELLHRRARWADLQRLSSLGTIAGQLAHRLNNPLSAITLATDTLRSSTDPDERDELLTVIEEQALLAGALAAELRDRAVPEPVELMEVDLAAWLAAEIPTLQLSGFEVVEDRPAVATTRHGLVDPDRLSQALLETVRVAHQAAGRVGDVRVGLAQTGAQPRLKVVHDGSPPGPEQLTALRAWSGAEDLADRSAAALAAARNHLEAQGGSLEVEIDADEAGEVRFVLGLAAAPTNGPATRGPRQEQAAASRGQATAPTSHAPGRASGDGHARSVRRALIVDDEPAIRGLLEALLRRAGWEVREASSLDAARRLLTDGEVEALLLDVDLGDGRLSQRLGALEQVRPGITSRTVLLSADPPSTRRLDGFPVAGKPFVWADLEQALTGIGAPSDGAL